VAVTSLAIVGTGLIGASVGLAARRAGVPRVCGFDTDPQALHAAAERGAIDVEAGELAEALDGVQLAVVATPVAALPVQIEAVLAAGDCTVTDVGSTKARICGAVSDRTRFIGGHPVCGSEARGPEHASGELFAGATWFLAPLAETEPARYRELHAFVASLGAVPVAIDPAAHDRLLALTSHLPHALANLLLNQAGATRVNGHEALAAAGGSLRDMTRVAGANPRIWVDIFLDNADALRSMLAEHRRRAEELERALETGDAGFLARWIGEAGLNRRRLLEQAYPDAGALQRLQLHIPDREGVLSGIFQALGAERINVEDFEFSHATPERGGTLAILVSGERAAGRAAELLEAQGYSVIVSPAFEDDGYADGAEAEATESPAAG
jgi:prephenate dehydrogenase